MAEVLPLSGNEFSLLASLLRHKVRFMVVGLSAAALQGAPVVTEDVDLWFEDLNDPNLTKALIKVGAGYVPPFERNAPMLAGKGSEPFGVVIRLDGLNSFSEEWKGAHSIKVGKIRLKVLPLERILASKLAANRPKDKLVVGLLKDTLETKQTKAAKVKENRNKSSRVSGREHRQR